MGLCLGSPAAAAEGPSVLSAEHQQSETAIQSNNGMSSRTTSTEGTFTGKFSEPTTTGSRDVPAEGRNSPGEGHILATPNLKEYTFADLKIAARNFKSDSLLGQGGFGKVFKGWVDEKTLAPAKAGGGMLVAIKKLNSDSCQGFQEWQSEVNFLGRLSHPNLVRLLGYCWEEKELLLVYEFMQKGSLENHLFRRSSAVEPISWDTRLKIAIGAARGLAFLHSSEKQIIYRDFKASNILLDGASMTRDNLTLSNAEKDRLIESDLNYNAKISDFGLAKLGPSGGDTHVSTRVMGTYGYAAPEYIATGHLYVKSDVYGFGVVLLEILMGKRAFDRTRPEEQQNLAEWSRPYLARKDKVKKYMDERMEGQYSPKAAFQAAQLALKCLNSEPRSRPSMEEVVEALETIRDMPLPRESKSNKGAKSPTRRPAQPRHRHHGSEKGSRKS